MTQAGGQGRRVIDACAFHDFAANVDLVPYLSEGWGDLVKVENLKVKGMWQNVHPHGNIRPDAKPPAGGPAASDPAFLVQQLLEERGSERVVLGHQEGLLAAALPLPYEARAVVRALNDWTADRWLGADDRLYAHILIPSGMPDEAAAEIRRVGDNDRFVAVAMGPNGLNRPFGHPAYHPIYAAAAELDLPIVIQVGADNIADLGTVPTSVGLNATFSEYFAMQASPLMPHLTSLFTCGVFDLFPNIRVLVVGGGLAWIPQYVWRLDWNYKMVRRVEVPWSKKLPSEYLAEHVTFTTYSLERKPTAEQLETVLELIPNVEESLVYASGYPYVDGDDAETIASRVPSRLHEGLFHGNAEAFYRWPGTRRDSAAASTEVTGAGVA